MAHRVTPPCEGTDVACREYFAEHDAAAQLGYQLAGGIVCIVDKPDAPGRQSRPGGRPDWVFEDSRQQRYVIEVGRLVPPTVRELEAVILKGITRPLGELPGTFVLIAPDDRLKPEQQATIRQSIEQHLQAGHLPDDFSPVPGIFVQRAGDPPASLVPWIVVPDLPCNAAADDPQVQGLRSEFECIVKTASAKFQGFEGRRILLLRLVQSGLDRDYHVFPSLGRPGLLSEWLAPMTGTLTAVDDVWLDPGLRVWRQNNHSITGAGTLQRVLTGHRYLDTPSPKFHRLVRKVGR